MVPLVISVIGKLFVLVIGLVLLLGLPVWLVYFLVSLPLRRLERARFFLDLLETGLKDGRSPENTVVAAAQCRDRSVGVRFHLMAAQVESGSRLAQALDKVPRFLPPQINAMLKVGEELGDVAKVLPACRYFLKDGLSQTRGALNYLIVLAFVLTPVVPAIFIMLSIFIFPKFLAILTELEVGPPPLTLFVVNHATAFAVMVILAGLLVYVSTLIYVTGPRLSCWLQFTRFPLPDWIAWQLPWRRKRMQRDFCAMLAILLDGGVSEDRAMTLAAASTANAIFIKRAELAVEELRAGRKLPEAVGQLDDTGEFRWRLGNACHGHHGFVAALTGWLEALDAKAFQQEQIAAQTISTALVLFNGAMIGTLITGTFQALVAVIETAVLW